MEIERESGREEKKERGRERVRAGDSWREGRRKRGRRERETERERAGDSGREGKRKREREGKTTVAAVASAWVLPPCPRVVH